MTSTGQDMRSAVEQLLREFVSTADLSYKAFSTKLKVTSYPDTILGIRMPVVRRTAGNLSKCWSFDKAVAQLYLLAEKWYEYKLLLGLVLKKVTEGDEVEKAIPILYSLCDGWAVPDLYQEVLGHFAKLGRLEEVLRSTEEFASCPNEFARRLSIVAYFPLLREGLVGVEQTLKHIALLEFDSAYYVEMANAWLLAEIKLTHPEVSPVISNPSLEKRYLQKLRESLRYNR
ncbi:DNA alkylation repair protein [uncultured Porphyromonas sp.]|uniref:DNA alkylation repair protein n=1 Tax=uncultured Porphyromonas sp. TaxID=159274 RepID=UPI00261A2A1E|nr:DNA alkylation repair protein [uncultured Porphyromonas sp.]